MSSKIGKLLPESVKRPLIRLHYVPEKIGNKIYRAAAQGKIPFPDKAFQKWDYRIFNNKKLNIDNPVTYNEKLQWMKYYYRNPAYTPLVDKYAVRKYVEEKAGGDILVPCLGVFDKWEDIDFDTFPDKFVLKCTHDSGSIAICRDKRTWDKAAAESIIKKGLQRNQFYLSREWPYKNVQPRIIAEQYLENTDGSSLVDYKFFCFDGKPVLADVLTGKNRNETVCENFYDLDWTLLDVSQGHPNTSEQLPKPQNFDKMLAYSKVLSAGMPHVRVDFLEENEKLYFTELTFYNAGGRAPFAPESFDLELGQYLTLPEKMR